MTPRYRMLKEAVAALAESADQQNRLLTARGFSAEFGNDELALGLDDAFAAAADMMATGELTQAQAEAAGALDRLLASWGEPSDVWRRDSLWSDDRWEQARALARAALDVLP